MARRSSSRPLRVVSLLPAGLVRWALALLTVALAAFLGGSYALTAVGRYLVVDDDPRKADAIVVLSGDGGARLEQGVELYRRGYAPVLILTGAGQGDNPPAAQVMQSQAREQGVPASAILLVNQSTSTREDALYTRELMVRRGLKSAILVTSPYHQRRAALSFARAFEGSGIQVASYPVHDDQWQPDTWWQSGRTLRLTLTELSKLLYYKLNGYI